MSSETVVFKVGNSLAVRIPDQCARQAHLNPGDAIEIEVTPTGDLRLRPVAAEPFNKSAFLQQVKRLRSSLAESEAIVETMRQSDRY